MSDASILHYYVIFSTFVGVILFPVFSLYVSKSVLVYLLLAMIVTFFVILGKTYPDLFKFQTPERPTFLTFLIIMFQATKSFISRITKKITKSISQDNSMNNSDEKMIKSHRVCCIKTAFAGRYYCSCGRAMDAEQIEALKETIPISAIGEL